MTQFSEITGGAFPLSGHDIGANKQDSLQDIIDSGISRGLTDPTAPTTFSRNDNASGDERLYMITPRSGAASYTSDKVTDYISDRGPITYIRLLTNDDGKSVTDRQYKKIDISSEVKELLADTGFSKFFLTGMQFSLDEKTQITPTFGDGEVVYYFGRSPVTMNLSGIVFDHLEGDWFTKFLTLHQTVFRGTQLAKNFEMLEFVFPNMKVKASISNLSLSQDSQREHEIGFNMVIVVKDVVPIAVPDISEQSLGFGAAELIDWSIGKEGVGGWGYNLSIGSLGGGITDSWAGDLADIKDSITGTIDGAMESLIEFRSSIFSPVYGIVSSITKVVKALSGNISDIISSFTNPINKILAQSMSFATGAIALANMIEASVNDNLGMISSTVANFKNTTRAMKMSAGVLSRLPENLSDIAKRHYNRGNVKKTAALLSSGKKRKISKAAVLASGSKYTPQNSYVIK